MIPTEIVLVALVLAIIAGAVFAFLWQSGKTALVVEKAEHAKTKVALTDALAVVDSANSLAAVAKARLEKQIENMRAEIKDLESDLAACNDPGAVRSRLRKLLSGDDQALSNPSASSSEPVPPGATP